MESIIQYLFSALIAFLIFIFVTLKIASTNRSTHQKLPPGPWKLQIIGNLHQLIGSLPHHRLRDLSRIHGPLMHVQLGELSHVVISSAEAAREIMRTHDINFVQRPQMLSSTFYQGLTIGLAPYGEYWRQLRRICVQELLSPTCVRSLQPIREEEVSKLVKDLGSASGSIVNLSQKIFSMTYGITAKAAFGKKCRDQELFISRSILDRIIAEF